MAKGLIRGGYRAWIAAAEGGGSSELFRISGAHDEWNHLVIPLIAMDRGFLADEGLTHVELIATENEADQIDGLDAGWIDVAVDPLASLALGANAQGRQVFVGAGRRRGYTFLLYGAHGINSVADLRGKRIVTTEPNSVTDVQGREIMRRQGLEPDTDVFFVYQGGLHEILDTFATLERGEAEAVLVPVSMAPSLESRGYPLLVDSGEFFKPRHDRITCISGGRLQRDAGSLVACFRAFGRAARVVLDRSEADVIRDQMEACGFSVRGPHDGEQFDLILEALYSRVDPAFALPLDGLAETIEEGRREGVLPPDFAIEQALRLDPLQAAQEAQSVAAS